MSLSRVIVKKNMDECFKNLPRSLKPFKKLVQSTLFVTQVIQFWSNQWPKILQREIILAILSIYECSLNIVFSTMLAQYSLPLHKAKSWPFKFSWTINMLIYTSNFLLISQAYLGYIWKLLFKWVMWCKYNNNIQKWCSMQYNFIPK